MPGFSEIKFWRWLSHIPPVIIDLKWHRIRKKHDELQNLLIQSFLSALPKNCCHGNSKRFILKLLLLSKFLYIFRKSHQIWLYYLSPSLSYGQKTSRVVPNTLPQTRIGLMNFGDLKMGPLKCTYLSTPGVSVQNPDFLKEKNSVKYNFLCTDNCCHHPMVVTLLGVSKLQMMMSKWQTEQ